MKRSENKEKKNKIKETEKTLESYFIIIQPKKPILI